MAKYDVFISYSRKDMAVANRLCDALDKLGVSYWIDRNIHGSANFLSEITRYIRNCKVVVFIASPNSAQSEWTQKEILFALKHKKEIIPYRIGNFHFEDNDELDFVFTNVQWIESEAAVVSALKELGCTFGSTPAPTPAPKPVPTPKSPRNPINWRKWIKGSAVGALVVALMALFAYAMFAPDAIVEPTAAEDSVSIVNTVKTQPIQKEKQVAQTAEKTAPKQSVENSKDTEVKQSNKPKQQTTQTSSKESASPKVTTASTATTQQNASSVATSTAKPNALTSAPYKVGDYYNDGTKEGVVFEVSTDGCSGKIVSMAQSSRELQWLSDKTELNRLIGADSRTNGAYNMAKVKAVSDWQSKYPAFKWCAIYGKDWYLPSIEELKKFTLDVTTHDAVNRTLVSEGGVKLYNCRNDVGYWSSTEHYNRIGALSININNEDTNCSLKTVKYYVRAVSAFGSAPTTTASTSLSKTYKVGDYYNDGAKEGVVFEVSADGQHGKIVSMTQSREGWTSDEAEQKRLIGADSKTDGDYNMAKVKTVANWQSKYPAFKWCADLGEGWYLPSIEELKKFTLDNAVHDSVNHTLTSKGGEKLINRGDQLRWYWSSTESGYQWPSGEFCAWSVNMYGGYTFHDYKHYNYYVRAVSAF